MQTRWAVGALCAASGLALPLVLAVQDSSSARCHAAEQQEGAAAAAAAAKERELAALAEWLRQQGADVDAVSFKQSDKDAGRFGVYAAEAIKQRAARGWLGTVAGWAGWGRDTAVPIAAFPLSSTITAANLAQHPQQGPLLTELLQLGVADERSAVILHLAVERHRLRLLQAGRSGGSSGSAGSSGSGSGLPWLALLPDSFSTTLYFSELDLQWLRGTTLHKATRLRQKALRDSWARLHPAAAQLAERSGLAGAPSFEDWEWSNSVFWSRAIAFPGPTPEGRVEMQEGIVPGLDFCNHASPSPCYWTLSAAAAALKGGSSSSSSKAAPGAAGDGSVDLVCPRRAVPAPGQEVTIDYGGKSNEELMFLYGFAIESNPDEVLTLVPPLPPPGEWDDLLQARLLLLQRRGLRPQLHLPASHLPRLDGGVGPGAGSAKGHAGSGSSGSDADVLASDLPEHVLEVLEVFVMQPCQVAAELEALGAAEAAVERGGSSRGNNGSGSSGSGGAAAKQGLLQQQQQQQQQQQGQPGQQQLSEAELCGQRMAVLTTLVRLLEVKAVEMEGREEGTGPLEADQQLLAAAGKALSRNQRHALLYRMGQKALARAYLAHAKRLLQREMAHLARLQQRA